MWECFRLVEYRFMWTSVLLNRLFVAKWAKCLKFVIINCFAPPPWENLDQKGLTPGHFYIFLVRFKKEEKSKQHFLPIFPTFSSCPAFAFKRSVYRALTTGLSQQGGQIKETRRYFSHWHGNYIISHIRTHPHCCTPPQNPFSALMASLSRSVTSNMTFSHSWESRSQVAEWRVDWENDGEKRNAAITDWSL